MDKQAIEQLLKEDLGVKKELIALKPLKEIPPNIPQYEGVATPGLCAQVGEVLKSGATFYTTRENHQCYEGLIATGVCEVSREEYRKAVEGFIDDFPYHKDVATAMSFYETCIGTIKPPKVENACLVVGPLSKVDDPDLVLIFCNPKQADILIRIQAYLGDLFKGYGGSGGCIFTVRQAFKTREPSFSTSDLSWRMFVGLNENELTVTYPYEKLLEVAPHIKSTADYVNSFSSMFDNLG
jgi:uncharacterized protein (DUF169 family)